MQKAIVKSDVTRELSKPFASSDIEWRLQQSGVTNGRVWGMALCYVTNRAIQNRLDDVFGVMDWKNEFINDGKTMMCGISVRHEKTGEWVTKWDGVEIEWNSKNNNDQIDPIKTAISNSMKRCAVHWGIGRYLYKLESGFIDCFQDKTGKNRGVAKDKQSGHKTYFTWNPPRLPDWALPEEERHQTPQPQPQYNKPVQAVHNNTQNRNAEELQQLQEMANQVVNQVVNRTNQKTHQQAQQQRAIRASQERNRYNEKPLHPALDLYSGRNSRMEDGPQSHSDLQQMANQNGWNENVTRETNQPIIKAVTPVQVKDLRNAFRMAGMEEWEFLDKARITNIGQMTQERLPDAMQWLRNRSNRLQGISH